MLLKIFISGGCKSGKSTRAQQIAQKLRDQDKPLYYIATMIPADSEDEARIVRHRQERDGCGFETVEAGRDLLKALENCNRHGTFLLDSVTALLANEMFKPDCSVEPEAHIKVANDLTEFLSTASKIVIVSDFIFSDALLYDDLTEAYRRGLAFIGRQMASACDVVLEACGGSFVTHKGREYSTYD